jgi:hypothetical protein
MDKIVFLNQINTTNAIDFMDEMNYMEGLWKDEKLFLNDIDHNPKINTHGWELTRQMNFTTKMEFMFMKSITWMKKIIVNEL